MTTARQVLDVARSQVGYVETPVNITRYGAWYGLQGAPWCAMFVSWCAAEAAALDIIPKHAYTPAGAAWFRDRGRWVTDSPRPGDIAYLWYPSLKRIAHVGFVEDVLPDGRVVTIEGNTDSAGGRTGGRVMRRHRAPAVPAGTSKVARIVGYGRPAYATATAAEEDDMPTLQEIEKAAHDGALRALRATDDRWAGQLANRIWRDRDLPDTDDLVRAVLAALPPAGAPGTDPESVARRTVQIITEALGTAPAPGA